MRAGAAAAAHQPTIVTVNNTSHRSEVERLTEKVAKLRTQLNAAEEALAEAIRREKDGLEQ